MKPRATGTAPLPLGAPEAPLPLALALPLTPLEPPLAAGAVELGPTKRLAPLGMNGAADADAPTPRRPPSPCCTADSVFKIVTRGRYSTYSGAADLRGGGLERLETVGAGLDVDTSHHA